MRANQYVLMSEYGDIFADTAAWTAQGCDRLATDIARLANWRELGCCVVKLIPAAVEGMGQPNPAICNPSLSQSHVKPAECAGQTHA